MKTILWVAFIGTALGCAAPSTQETTSSQDSTITATSADSVIVTPAPITVEAKPLIISDSSAQAINDVVTAEFDKFFADSASYYKVMLTDYYDEYEGQNEYWNTIWYLNQKFAVIYYRYANQNGAMRSPTVTEYLIRNDSIVSAKETSDASYGDRTIILWNIHSGGTRLLEKDFDKKITAEALPDNYGPGQQASWDSSLDSVKPSGSETSVVTNSKNIVTFLTEKPKASELMDYTKVTIPKIVLDKLKSDDN